MSESADISIKDRQATIKSVILFIVLTVLNISVFVIMVFENQMDLIVKNAELESKNRGIRLKLNIEKIVKGDYTGVSARRYKLKTQQAHVYTDYSDEKRIKDTLENKAELFVKHEFKDWFYVEYGSDSTGWVRQEHTEKHLSAWESGKLDVFDVRSILKVLKREDIEEYTVFLESGEIVGGSRRDTGDIATESEKNLIQKAVFKNSFEHLAFYHNVNKKEQHVELYIPVYYSPTNLFVIKSIVSLESVWEQTDYLYRLCIIVGVFILIVHIFFVMMNERFIIRPMVHEHTVELRNKNKLITEKNIELEKMAITDKLTGLYNARYFHEILIKELKRIERADVPKLSLILIDVDNFKKLNDTKGHRVGDQALSKIGEIIRTSIRKDIDTAYRYGGDEFVVILPDTARAGADVVAKRIVFKYAQCNFPPTSVSAGIAEAVPGMDKDVLIKQADEEMYKNKKSHR